MSNRVRPARSKPTPEQEGFKELADNNAGATHEATAGAQAAMQQMAGNQAKGQSAQDKSAAKSSENADPHAAAGAEGAGQSHTVTDPSQSTQSREAAQKSGLTAKQAAHRDNQESMQQDQAAAASASGGTRTGGGQRAAGAGRAQTEQHPDATSTSGGTRKDKDK